MRKNSFCVFRVLHGDGQLRGCFTGFTRKTPPQTQSTLQNPKEPGFSYFDNNEEALVFARAFVLGV
jgi:hypothetical protein